MSSSTCPICFQQVLSIELERHANDHFEDEDLARDMELAQAIAVSSSIPSNLLVDDAMRSGSNPVTTPESSSSTWYEGRTCSGRSDTNGKIRCLVSLQVREPYFKVNHSLIALLKNCLECEPGNSTSILSGYVDHFQSVESEDVGWGCGWRNIQMLSSHLLVHRQEAKKVLFGGSGFVPDISSLQRWLEIAWERGFDTAGSTDFNGEIYGKRKWIGTTECVALFRSFGLRARIMDFCSSSHEVGCLGSNIDKRKSTQVTGPMDRYLRKPDADAGSGFNKKDKHLKNFSEKVKGHQLLVNWVWAYFSHNTLGKSSCNRVIVTEKAPLYFQQDGHSRTIIGIQLKNPPNGMQQYNLLILDPGHKTEVLERCLSKKVGWQKFIKRGVHTLKKPEYQLCYMDPGIASCEEIEKLKTLESNHFEI